MNSVVRFFSLFLILGIGLSACRKDRDTGDNGGGDSGLKAYLNGNFDLTQVDYNGTFGSPAGSIPLSGTGTGTSGNFDFTRGETVDYNMNTELELEIPFIGAIPVPLAFSGQGTVTILSETRFSVEDGQSATPRIFDVRSQEGNELRLRTDIEVDTLQSQIKLTMDLYLQK